MKVLLTGATGQLGCALQMIVPAGIQLIAYKHSQLDLADSDACRQVVITERPDWVLNAGAFTGVDKAESESELAGLINAGAPAAFSEALANCHGRLLQLSTDFVFSGFQGKPYGVEQKPDPLGVYGRTKAEGEIAALRLPGAKILRTSWVYGPVGKNFFLTMLRLHASRAANGESISVVSDQVGCPTATYSLASACWRAITSGGDIHQNRVLHWSDAGAATWYDFAVAIGELALSAGLIKESAEIRPIHTVDYPTPAQRPSYSLLDCASTRKLLRLEPPHWRTALSKVIHSLSPEDI